jgi:hypothetical protein
VFDWLAADALADVRSASLNKAVDGSCLSYVADSKIAQW